MTTRKLSKLNIFSFSGIQMRTFHITWLTFFVCFFGWFGIAPLMPIIREDLHLTKPQIGNAIIAAVSMTVFARLLIGRLCDTIGPRLTYTGLLLIGAIPVMGIGLSHSYESFLWFRLAIGVIGASFVITQFHTSAMFADNIKGTANAVAGGWGNLGGGVTNMVMPLILAGFVGLGYTNPEAWRLAMVVPGVMLLIMAFVYYRYTKDTPEGNYSEIERTKSADSNPVSFAQAAADWRVWALFLAYGACFGIEITFDGVAALYFTDTFKLDLATAGLLAGVFGFMNLFARAVGGIVADKVGAKYGMRGKGLLLAGVLLLEGLGIMLFSQTGSLAIAVVAMLGFAMFLKMANGATYAIVPFVNKRAVGVVSGIVGAGGNVGGVLAGFLFKSESISYEQAFLYIGMAVAVVAIVVVGTRFDKKVAIEPIAVPEVA
ncbi:MFS transporter [Spirosoma taeanense]|uniref:MFS transporter n=1 Tax=Spirosoma taeanense TaxID=2735870 RepID=A0A6M5YCK3_9BACT|nr:MFS transporter [Spirosoma taeanense]QJW91817.1 MFS transporter [Spirosoma taeanense]